ncbi:hypothetical protein N7491_009121 [Penicillium cf. griseofulvum]|uniref:Uncharacterized protein n=1 Tax=Penicillium cf. griseofulvum TaxID=2972120 RepID=A0A9W9MFI0_9EURO|nr:hypothetical protein N7472_005283 [Penicillium cf. griseofulvum]KAJ5423905.1 hypothetical protein N7491_009121 [Penicillium cf. griseofulvum]
MSGTRYQLLRLLNSTVQWNVGNSIWLELAVDSEDFFYKEYFQFPDRGHDLAHTLYKRILGNDKAKTPLIPDNWDETHG